MNIDSFIKKIYPLAKRIGDIDPVFTTAQAGLESAWGERAISVYNLFGVTRGSWPDNRCTLAITTEYFKTPDKRFVPPEKVIGIPVLTETGGYKYRVLRFFRVYKSYDEALNDHLELFKKPFYADAWKYRGDAKEFLKHIVDDVGLKYATSPKYRVQMLACIDSVKRRLAKYPELNK